jgi:hypothetical protein
MPKDADLGPCDIFVNLPHAVDQFKERGGFPGNYDSRVAETDLKRLIAVALRDGQERLVNVRNQDKQDGRDSFVLRIQIPHRQVVFPIVEVGKPGGKYAYMVYTVLSQSMYQSWSREQKLGTLGDKLPQLQQLKEEVRDQEVQKKMAEKEEEERKKQDGAYLLIWPDENHVYKRKYVLPGELEKEVLHLLMKGVPLSAFEVYQRVPLKLSTINLTVGEEK